MGALCNECDTLEIANLILGRGHDGDVTKSKGTKKCSKSITEFSLKNSSMRPQPQSIQKVTTCADPSEPLVGLLPFSLARCRDTWVHRNFGTTTPTFQNVSTQSGTTCETHTTEENPNAKVVRNRRRNVRSDLPNRNRPLRTIVQHVYKLHGSSSSFARELAQFICFALNKKKHGTKLCANSCKFLNIHARSKTIGERGISKCDAILPFLVNTTWANIP